MQYSCESMQQVLCTCSQHDAPSNHDHPLSASPSHSQSPPPVLNCARRVPPLPPLLLLLPPGLHILQAGGALTRYHVNAVVANLLHTRKDRVLIVQQGSGSQGQQQQQVDAGHGSSSMDVEAQLQVIEVLRAADEPHIEKQLVANIVGLHELFRQEQQEKQRL